MRFIPRRLQIKVPTRISNEKGSANVLGFIFALIILIPAFFLFMFLNASKTAKVNFDTQVINTARAAASATYTSSDGQLLIDCARAAVVAQETYALYRPFNVDQLGIKLMEMPRTPETTVRCGDDLKSVQVTVTDYYSGTLLTRQMFPSFTLTSGADALLVRAELLP